MKFVLILIILGVVSFFVLKNTAPTTSNPGSTPENTQEDVKETSPVETIIEKPQEEVMQKKQYEKAPDMVIDTNKKYIATMKTSKGDMSVTLFTKETPVTVNNFVFLAKENYFNGVIFHRVIKGFMAQGGDPTGTGRGGPGYTFQDEIVDTLKFDKKGLLAMANAGPATNGSQFFITFVPTSHLNGAHTIFGEINTNDTKSFTTLAAIEDVSTSVGDTPTEPIVIQSVTITEE